jgi:ribonuclease-3
MKRFFEAIIRRFRGGAGRRPPPHELERLIGYRFVSRERLIEALTHRSTIGDLKPGEERVSYERLEFLGDSVLSLVTSDFLMRNYPEENEGQLTKKKSLLVSKGVLSKKADEIGIKPYIILSESAERGGVADQDSVLTAALEALIGAIYVDGGFEQARGFIEDRILGDVDEFLEHRDHVNFKSILQEWVQSKYRSYPRYSVKSTTGPEHDKIFIIEVKVAGRPVGKGRGKSKKDAEQMAAKEALHALRKTHEEGRRKW